MKKLIVGNWKMNPIDSSVAREMFLLVRKQSVALKSVQTVICPPSIFLGELKSLVSKNCLLGTQNVFYESQGAFTGETSPVMVKNSGFKYVIIGHSERREMGESDLIVSKKVNACLKSGLKTILCVGEKTRDESGDYYKFIRQQLTEDLIGVAKKDLKNLIVAYEPIWAIGKNALRVATPEDVMEVSIFIKKVLSEISSREMAMNVQILYGGSVNEKNSENFLKFAGVSGFLVGRASLDPQVFNKILRIADNVK